MRFYEALLAILIIILTCTMALYYEPRWVIVMISAAITYGGLSSIVAARRLYFLASASPHAALLAAVLGIPLSRLLGLGSDYLWALAVGIVLVYGVGYAIHRGVDPDTATATFVALTASASVLAIYYVLTNYPLETDISAIIIGDPLLARWIDSIASLAIASITFLAVLLTYRENIAIGLDADSVKLAGVRTSYYNLLVFTLIAVTMVGLIRIVGFVLEHVLVLLPATIASTIASSSKQAFFISIVSSILSALAGLYIAVELNLSPAGTTGIILFALYIVALIARRR